MYTNRRYFILILLFIASMINYIDRAALSILAPYITTDLNVNKAELGLIFSSFAIGYAVFCFVGGWLADKYGPRRIFAGSMGLWSLFAGLTCAAFNFASLFVIRVIFGAAEGPMGSVTNKTIVKWFPVKERARRGGFVLRQPVRRRGIGPDCRRRRACVWMATDVYWNDGGWPRMGCCMACCNERV